MGLLAALVDEEVAVAAVMGDPVLELVVSAFLVEHRPVLGRPFVDLVSRVESLAAPVHLVGDQALVGRAAVLVVGGDRPLLRPEGRHVAHVDVQQEEREHDRRHAEPQQRPPAPAPHDEAGGGGREQGHERDQRAGEVQRLWPGAAARAVDVVVREQP